MWLEILMFGKFLLYCNVIILYYCILIYINICVASQCLGYSLCAKFRVVFKIPKVPNSLSVQISGSFINEAWYHFWPNI